MKPSINKNVTKVTRLVKTKPPAKKLGTPSSTLVNKRGVKTANPDVLEQSVKSSNLKHVSYNKKTKMLTITFNNQRVYNYFAVPLITVSRLLTSASKGTYFERNIRYRYRYSEQ